MNKANLRQAIFYKTNLTNTILSHADLSHATFYKTDLSGIDLSDTILAFATGNMKEIKNISIMTNYPIVYTKNIVWIRDKSNTLEGWKAVNIESITSSEDDIEVLEKLLPSVLQLIEASLSV